MQDPRFHNPLWHTLSGAHRALARGDEEALRYPAELLPFVAVPAASEACSRALDALTLPGDSVVLVGVCPPLSAQWRVMYESEVMQLACDTTVDPGPDGHPLLPLSADDVPDMLALTQLAYPGFFRAGTQALGEFRGIRVNGQLVSVVGTRMQFGDWRELTTICTHPDFTGRGFSRHLVSTLVADLLAAGLKPFLHVEDDNAHALTLYQRWGFRVIGHVHMQKIDRL